MKCISCQNEIQDGSINCPICGTIQNNNYASQPVQPVQPGVAQAPVQPVQQPGVAQVPVQPVQQPGVPVQQQPVQQPGIPVQQQPVQQPGTPNSQPQALGTVSQRAAIAQGIQSGNLVNGMYTAGEIIGSKEHQNFINEEKKENKKKLITTAIIVGILIVIIVSGFIFYRMQYHSADERITKIFDGLSTTISSSVKNNKVQTNSGEYTLSVKVDRSDKKYGIETSGKYAYDLTKSIDVTTNISQINFGEELLDSKELNLEVYLNESKVYLNLQNFLEKYIYTEFAGFNKIKSQISQNNISYILLVKNPIKDISKALKTISKKQEIGTSSITGKKANIIKIDLDAETRKILAKRYVEGLIEDQAFIEQLSLLTGEDETAINSDLHDLINKFENSGDSTYTVEFHTGIFNKDFYGIKIVKKGSENSNITIKMTSNGYKVRMIKDNNQLFDITYSKSKGTSSTSDTTKHSISGSVFYDNVASNIDVQFDVVEFKKVEVPDIKVKDSVNVKNLTTEDISTIISKLDQYPKLKSLLTPSLEGIISMITPSQQDPMTGCSSFDDQSKCIDPIGVPTGDTTTTGDVTSVDPNLQLKEPQTEVTTQPVIE